MSKLNRIRKMDEKYHKNTDDNCSSEKNESRNIKIADIRAMDIIPILDNIICLSEGYQLNDAFKDGCGKYIRVLSEKLHLSEIQSLLLAVFVKNCDDNHIRYRDIAIHFSNCKTIDIVRFKEDIDSLVRKNIIIQKKERGDDNVYFRIPHSTLLELTKNRLPEVCNSNEMTIEKWLESIEKLFERFSEEEFEDDEFDSFIQENLKNNQHLECVRKISDLKLQPDALRFFMAMCIKCIVDDDNDIYARDVIRYFDKYEFRHIQRTIESEEHPLMKLNLIEFVCENGHACPHRWCLTDYAKREILSEFSLVKPVKSSKLKSPDTIEMKTLYYDEEISCQIDRLRDLLNPERMSRVLNELSSRGYRKGFACLFYGGPGTGKTETVLQLARDTGRSILQIDISSIRDKYVGETEKRIKHCFDAYRKFVKECERAPILFFNEADALFMTRTENAEDSVDKMENAMQNIILQEMETLEGILIATTNLTGSLDPAFERRFLFKIEFTKPSAEARKHIWQTMIPDLNEADALMLAKRFDFSGGQIENIARKRIIDDILNERYSIDIDSIVDDCRHESIEKNNKSHKIGFA